MLGNHQRVVLQFSGGKDSLACLHLLREYWPRLTVLWMNSGDAFPETVRQMAQVRDMVPNFMEVTTDQPANVRLHGHPSDVVSVWATPLGKQCRAVPHAMQTPFSCCGSNLWEPMAKATKEFGATLVIRGQRDGEQVTAPLRSGMVIDGIEYLFPIAGWSDYDVRAYLRDNGVALPLNYAYMNSSLDCQHCTAYLFENAGKFDYMRVHHPALHDEVQHALRNINQGIENELSHLKHVMRVE